MTAKRLKYLKDFDLNAKARIRPCLAYVFHIPSTAVPSHVCVPVKLLGKLSCSGVRQHIYPLIESLLRWGQATHVRPGGSDTTRQRAADRRVALVKFIARPNQRSSHFHERIGVQISMSE